MNTTALVVDGGAPQRIGGLTLTERAILLTSRAGCAPIHVWGPQTLDPASAARLRARGVIPVQLPSAIAALEKTADDSALLVIGPGVLFGPALLPALVDASEGRRDGRATAVSDGQGPLLIHLPRDVYGDIRACGSVEAMAAGLAARGALQQLPLAGMFCRRVTGEAAGPALEREYIRHLTGRGESYFTKKIRRFSVPLTTRLVRLGARPTHVTLGGLALAIVSAWLMAQGNYGAGLLGAVLYYASMIFDCSDGEVARVTIREGPSGAWLETVVDYITYFLVLAAVTIASQTRPHAEAYRLAAWTALAGTVVVVIVAGYLRHRVAAADPGQFDDASAKALAAASGFHRFARWGRQWIKRSTIAHLVVFLALVNQLPAILYLWAFGAVVASVVIVAVEPFVVRRVSVAPAGARLHG